MARKKTKNVGGSAGKAPRGRRAPKSPSLYTIRQLVDKTKISYPTVLKYIKQEPTQFPFEQMGARKLYTGAALVYLQERKKNRAALFGRQKKAAAKRKATAAKQAPKTQATPIRRRSTSPRGGASTQLTSTLERLTSTMDQQSQLLREILDELKKPSSIYLGKI